MPESAHDSATLEQVCIEAFNKYPKSCSHSVWYVIQKYKPDQMYLTANQLILHVTASSEWQEVQLSELSMLASEGILVVGGKIEKDNGHVIVVYPGPAKQSGGYIFKDRKTGKNEVASPHGLYARAMSTSMGSWPGAISNGNRTVFDPWGPVKFKGVKFWKYVGPVKSKQ